MAPDSINTSGGEIAVNGRRYRLPKQPVVVVCIDGSEPGYIERAVEAGRAPWFGKVLTQGTNLLADCVVPSFTNPNNLSIVTGQPPAVHGICGNYFLDPDSGQGGDDERPEVPAGRDLVPGLPARRLPHRRHHRQGQAARASGQGPGAGRRQGLQLLLGEVRQGDAWPRTASTGVNALVGMDVPDVYSAGLSEFVFAAGVKLMERDRPQIMYLSTTDYIQHKHAPGTPVANDFYAMMDGYMARLDAMGCTVVLTADHGMNAKFGADGQPDVIYLQDVFDGWLGKDKARVILPITDPYVVHHGALGSFAVVYLPAGTTAAEMAARLKAMPGIEAALSKEEAAQRFELPADRLGDLVVVSTKHKVLGTSAARHDLSGLTEPLRSHGGVSEQKVPLLCNRKLAADAASRHWRNFDAFDLALNLVA